MYANTKSCLSKMIKAKEKCYCTLLSAEYNKTLSLSPFQFDCCGVDDVGPNNREEFINSVWYQNRGTKEIPYSCCKVATEDNYKTGVDASCTDGNYIAVNSDVGPMGNLFLLNRCHSHSYSTVSWLRFILSVHILNTIFSSPEHIFADLIRCIIYKYYLNIR